MASKKYSEFSQEGLAKTGAIIGFIMWLVALLWHGMLSRPMMYSSQYVGTNMSAGVLGGMLVGLVVGGFIFGWIAAFVYNWTLKH
ncbi:MAG TPA: hypothetical protein VI968_03720 [archaeon]|nr:hypothetical protein [archaeon]